MSLSGGGFDVARFARTMALIGFVTGAFLLLAAQQLSGVLFQVGVVAIGSVAIVTAISGALIAAASVIGQDDLVAARQDGSVDERGTPADTDGGPAVAPAEGETDGGTDEPDAVASGDHDRQ